VCIESLSDSSLTPWYVAGLLCSPYPLHEGQGQCKPVEAMNTPGQGNSLRRTCLAARMGSCACLTMTQPSAPQKRPLETGARARHSARRWQEQSRSSLRSARIGCCYRDSLPISDMMTLWNQDRDLHQDDQIVHERGAKYGLWLQLCLHELMCWRFFGGSDDLSSLRQYSLAKCKATYHRRSNVRYRSHRLRNAHHIGLPARWTHDARSEECWCCVGQETLLRGR
jgi:hypothetical protein